MPSPKLDEADGDARLVEAEYADRRTEQARSDFVRRVKERTVWEKPHPGPPAVSPPGGLFRFARPVGWPLIDPAGNQVDPNFGAFTAARDPRRIQLSLQFMF